MPHSLHRLESRPQNHESIRYPSA